MTKPQPRIPIGPPQDCSFSAMLQDIENVYQHRLAITLYKKCKIPGCERRLHATYGKWFLPPLATENKNTPTHKCEVDET